MKKLSHDEIAKHRFTIEQLRQAQRTPIYVILDSVRSLYNVGSIFRTADAAGISKLYLTGITPSPLDRFGAYRNELRKVSLGAEEWVSWEKRKSVASVIRKLKRDGAHVYAVEQSKRSVPYQKIFSTNVKTGKYCLVFGSETKGLPPSILKQADRIIEIPMKGKKESLNVSVAFGIVVYASVFFDRKVESSRRL